MSNLDVPLPLAGTKVFEAGLTVRRKSWAQTDNSFGRFEKLPNLSVRGVIEGVAPSLGVNPQPEKNLDHLSMSIIRGGHQRSDSIVAPRIDVSAMLRKDLE